MPIYNSKENEILVSLEETYRDMIDEKAETPEERQARIKTADMLADTPRKRARFNRERKLSNAKREGPQSYTPATRQKTKVLPNDPKQQREGENAVRQGGGGGGANRQGAAGGAQGGVENFRGGPQTGAGADAPDNRSVNRERQAQAAKKEREQKARERNQKKND